MAIDPYEERFRQHEASMQSLARILAAQHEKNQRYDVLIEQQAEFNRDVKITLARVETLLARMIRSEENGRDA